MMQMNASTKKTKQKSKANKTKQKQNKNNNKTKKTWIFLSFVEFTEDYFAHRSYGGTSAEDGLWWHIQITIIPN